MNENGVGEEDDVPWGALVVIEAKPHQENVTWHQYQWRLCVSHQKLNQFTRPFNFPTPRCYDTVEDIETEENYFSTVDMESGYWQVVLEEEARKILAFFFPYGNWWCKVMPMVALTADPKILVIMMML